MVATSIRVRLLFFVSFAVLVGGAGCTTGGPPAGGGGGGSEAADMGSDDSSGSGSGKVTVTLHRVTGIELSMRARVWIGDRALAPGEAANTEGLNPDAFSYQDIANGDPTVSEDVTREFNLADGQVMTLLAVESEPVINYSHFNEELPPETQVLLDQAINSTLEFVDFEGPITSMPEHGVAVITAKSEDIEVMVNYRRMPRVTIWRLGGAEGNVVLDALPYATRFGMVESPWNGQVSPFSVPATPEKLGALSGQFRSGSTVTLTPKSSLEFLRWEGDCEGGGSCELTFGGESGGEDQTATAIFSFLRCEFDCADCEPVFDDCPVGKSCDYSAVGKGGSPILDNCTIVRP